MDHTALRRRLRQNSTDAERALWRHLRGRRFGGFKFRRQHSLAPYIADFYCSTARLVIELDGGQHFESEQREYDQQRSHAFAQLGVRVLRFTNAEVLRDTDAVLEAIRKHLTQTLST